MKRVDFLDAVKTMPSENPMRKPAQEIMAGKNEFLADTPFTCGALLEDFADAVISMVKLESRVKD